MSFLLFKIEYDLSVATGSDGSHRTAVGLLVEMFLDLDRHISVHDGHLQLGVEHGREGRQRWIYEEQDEIQTW